MKSNPHAKTPEDYLNSVPAGRQEILRAVHEAIVKAAPSLVPAICHGMIGYGIGPYRTKSECEGDWFKVGLANQKQHVSLYLCASDRDVYLVEKNASRLGNVSVGKSCIRFKKLEDLNLEVAIELVKRAGQAS